MLEFLILLPLILVTILSMTFDVSLDELSNASRGNYFTYHSKEEDCRTFPEKVRFPSMGERGSSRNAEGCEELRQQWDGMNCGDCSHPAEDCPMGTFFQPESCRCIPVFGRRRPRPPV